MSRKFYLYCFFSLPVLVGCAAKSDTKVIVKPPVEFMPVQYTPVEMDTRFIADALKSSGKAFYFSSGITKLYEKDFFIYLDKADSLTFICLDDKSVKKVFIPSVIKKWMTIISAGLPATKYCC